MIGRMGLVSKDALASAHQIHFSALAMSEKWHCEAKSFFQGADVYRCGALSSEDRVIAKLAEGPRPSVNLACSKQRIPRNYLRHFAFKPPPDNCQFPSDVRAK